VRRLTATEQEGLADGKVETVKVGRTCRPQDYLKKGKKKILGGGEGHLLQLGTRTRRRKRKE